MDVAAQVVALRCVTSPDGFFELAATDQVGALLHEHLEQFAAGWLELEHRAGSGHLEGVEVELQVGYYQLATGALLAPSDH
ncbi:hypothetical protein D3C81_2143370 [compost metagenome]